jgi:hypothetical protein
LSPEKRGDLLDSTSDLLSLLRREDRMLLAEMCRDFPGKTGIFALGTDNDPVPGFIYKRVNIEFIHGLLAFW